MKALPLVLLCLLGPIPLVAAVEISTYHVRFTASEDGTGAGTGTLVLSGTGNGPLVVPLGFAATHVTLTAPEGNAGVQSERINGQTRLRFDLPAATGSTTRIDFSFTAARVFTKPEAPAGQKSLLPEGSRMMSHRLVNTEAATIGRYEVDITLPRTLRAHAVAEALPRPGKKEALPRVQMISSGGLPTVHLQAANLRQGDATSMQVEIVPAARSPFWLIAGVLLSALYLFYFRDLVAGRPGGEAPGSGIARPGE